MYIHFYSMCIFILGFGKMHNVHFFIYAQMFLNVADRGVLFDKGVTFNIYLLLIEYKVYTISHDKKLGSITSGTDRANKIRVIKIFIKWLFWKIFWDEPTGWYRVVILQSFSFSLLRLRPNGSKFIALHLKVVRLCNVKKIFIFEIKKNWQTFSKQNVPKFMAFVFIPADFIPADFIHWFVVLWTRSINPHTANRLGVWC